jgi:sugar/nucleoside kinase (ribokinase family)
MSTHEVDVLAVGLASYDISLFVDEFPRENSKMETHDMIEQGGGPAANAAYLLSLWGVGCAFAGLVGDDVEGQRILDEFKLVGTQLCLVDASPGHATAVSVILVNTTSGSRTIVNRKVPLGTLRLASAKLQQIHPRVLLFDGHELEASLSALGAYPDALSILDAGSLRQGTKVLAGKVKYLVASERFALQVSRLADVATDDAQRECLRRVRTIAREDAIIVITMGSRGLIYEDAGTFGYVPAFPVRAVDTTAAGDIFHGAFAFGVLRGCSFSDTLTMATLAAGMSVQRRGGRQSVPTLAAVEEEWKNVKH